MPDQAHRETDKELEKMERKLRTVYGQAAARSQQKADRFFEKFAELDRIKKQQVKEGKLDQETYLTWRRNKMAIGENYRAMVDTLTSDMVNTNRVAASVINGHLPDVYANNYNFGTYQIEHDSQINTSFTLYDRQTVERLMRDNPDIVPIKARVDIPKDKLWNKRKINDVITQSILTGDSIPDIAKSLQKVAEMNKIAAVRTARTATTSAQNGGRVDSYKRAQEMGIKLRQQWLATLDGRTRDSHRALDGEIIAVAKDKWHPAKFSNGCRFPGDPQGPGHEIYNCRCTLLGVVDGVDFDLSDVTQRDSKLGAQSYDEWKAGHKKKAPVKPVEKPKEPEKPTGKTQFNFPYGETEIFGEKVKVYKESNYGFTNGKSVGVHQYRDAEVYELEDGTKFIFPADMDKDTQSLSPLQLLMNWQRLPEEYRKQIQKTIEIVDYRNPQDKHWEEKFGIKDFFSYATGGEKITFYKYNMHSNSEIIRTLAHEGGHYIDNHQTKYDLAIRLSESERWADAAEKDLKLHSFDDYYAGVSDYAKQTLESDPTYFLEDFADSCSEYITNREFFEANFPNRAKILKAVLGI